MNQHGVLTADSLMMNVGHVDVELAPSTLEQLMDMALEYRLTHLWVLPAANLSFIQADATPLLDTAIWDTGTNGKFIAVQKRGKYKGYITSIVGRRLTPSRSPNTRIIFVRESNWPLDNASPYQLLTMCSKLEFDLDVSMAGSPTSVGLRYLEKMNTRYFDQYFQKDTSVDWEALKAEHVPFIAWFPSTHVDGNHWYLHAYDRNASHPFAASQEDMGVGSPIVQNGGEFDKKLPGLWNVEIQGADALPDCLPPLLPKSDVWLPTPLLRIASMAGCTINVKEALVWKKKAPIFQRWANNLYEFRQIYHDGSMERQAVKAIMNNVVGSTRIGQDTDYMLRPDWYATIIGSERGVVWYKLWKLWQLYGVAPCGVYADAAYYLSMSSDPVKAVPTLLAHKDALGGYKHVYTLSVNADVREVLSRKMGAAYRLEALKGLVKHD